MQVVGRRGVADLTWPRVRLFLRLLHLPSTSAYTAWMLLCTICD